MKCYAVRNGRQVGIFSSWEDCKRSVDGFSGAEYKSFKSRKDAINYLHNKSQILEIYEDTVLAYVDGSFSEGLGQYGSGILLITDDEEYEIMYRGSKYSKFKNVAGEVIAGALAMELAIKLNKKKVIIKHDYTGIAKWCLGEWKANNILTQQYQQEFDKYNKMIEIEFSQVPAHSGEEYNEIVDKLARKALVSDMGITYPDNWKLDKKLSLKLVL